MGGPVKRTRTGAIRLAVLLGLTDGRTSLNALVRRLKEPKTTLLRARDFLLLAGALEESSTPPGCFYSKGPAFDQVKATLEGGPLLTGGPVAQTGATGRLGRRFVLLTSGERTFQVNRSPAAPGTAVGCYTAKVVSSVPNFWFSHRDEDGRQWTMHYRCGKQSQSVTVHPPHVRRNQIPESPEGWNAAARNWVSKEAHRWASDVGFHLERSRQAIRDSRPVEYAMPGAAPEGRTWGDPGKTSTWVDPTPFPRTVETTDEQIADRLEVLVPMTDQFQENFRVLFPRMEKVAADASMALALISKSTEAMVAQGGALGALAVHVATQQGIAAQYQSAAAAPVAVASPSPSPLSKDSDNRSGYT